MYTVKKLNIIIQCNELPPHSTGGIGIQTLNLANMLHADGHNVTVIGVYNEVKKHDHPFRFIQLRRIKYLSVFGHFLNILKFHCYLLYFVAVKGNEADCIEYPDYGGYGVIQFIKTLKIVRLNNPDFYLSYWDRKPNRFWPNKSLIWYAQKKSILNADKVISSADYLIPITQKICGKLNIQRIYNLIQPEKNVILPAAIPQLPDKYILNVGSVISYKGVDLLVEAYSSVAERLNYSLVLAGRILSKEIHQKVIARNKQWETPRIFLLGEVHQNVLMRIITRSQALIFPSLRENMPLSWVETLGMGKAIWSSDIPCSHEIIDIGKNGFIFEKNSIPAIKKALIQIDTTGQEKMSIMEENAKKKYEQIFKTEKIYSQNLTLLYSVCAQKFK